MLCHVQSINILVVPLGIDLEIFEGYFDLFKSYSCIPIQDINNTIDPNKKVFVNFIPLFKDRNLGISEFMPQTSNFAIIGICDLESTHDLKGQASKFFKTCEENHPSSLAKCLVFNSTHDDIPNVTSIPNVGNIKFYVYQLLCNVLSDILSLINLRIKDIETTPYPNTPNVLKAFDAFVSPISSPTLKDLFSTTTDENRLLQLKSSGRTFKLLGDYDMLKGNYAEALHLLRNASDLLKNVDIIWYAGTLWSISICEFMLSVVKYIEPTTFRDDFDNEPHLDVVEINKFIKELSAKLTTNLLPLFESCQCHLLAALVLDQSQSLLLSNFQLNYIFKLECEVFLTKMYVHVSQLPNELIKAKYFIELAQMYKILKYPRKQVQFIYYAVKSITKCKPVFLVKSISHLLTISLNTLGFNPLSNYCCGWIYLLIEFMNHVLAMCNEHQLPDTHAFVSYIGLTRLYHYFNKDDQLLLMQHVNNENYKVGPLLLSMSTISTNKQHSQIEEGFIYNPYSQITMTNESIINIPILITIVLCNPYQVQLHISHLQLMSNQGVTKTKNITIQPKTISTLQLQIIPNIVGNLQINGISLNCLELSRLELAVCQQEFALNNNKYTGIMEIDRVTRLPQVVAPVDPMIINILPEQGILTTQIQEPIMLLQGEQRAIQIDILNNTQVDISIDKVEIEHGEAVEYEKLVKSHDKMALNIKLTGEHYSTAIKVFYNARVLEIPLQCTINHFIKYKLHFGGNNQLNMDIENHYHQSIKVEDVDIGIGGIERIHITGNSVNWQSGLKRGLIDLEQERGELYLKQISQELQMTLEHKDIDLLRWEQMELRVKSKKRVIKGMKMMMVVFKKMENNEMEICDITSVNIQGKMHRMMKGEMEWKTMIRIRVLVQGRYYIRCVVKDVVHDKIEITETFQLHFSKL